MDITDIIGRTPVVKFTNIISNPDISIYGKLEGTNPGGSVKDRPALWMIKKGIEEGAIKPGTRIVEPTSGNTGIALAMIGNKLGYSVELVMPEDATKERIRIMKAFGAKVTLTPAKHSMEGAIDRSRELVFKSNAVMLDQFSNPNNPLAHFQTTGPEIWQQTHGKITHFVSAMGTTGTIMGVSKYLKQKNNSLVVVGVQPQQHSQIPGIRHWPIEYLPSIYQSERVDRIIHVSQDQAIQMSRKLARQEGLFCGMSSGGAVHVATELAKELTKAVIVCIICDRGDRYLSSNLFL
jgi:cysteine synthase B